MKDKIKEINIPISEFDVEMLKNVAYDNDHFYWEFEVVGSGELIRVNFMSVEEAEQRSR
ncbi:MAG: hypothetical protein HON83_02985 [Candidatus Marinimicrobia bacterium]|jgi:hypothetical protein|nr:hypothetical protein [Candidatus Neomarinimicrobiota bacterium]MBT5235906.1 hypothetical protein [Candidatus Neomarinimicrobiota bacterium]